MNVESPTGMRRLYVPLVMGLGTFLVFCRHALPLPATPSPAPPHASPQTAAEHATAPITDAGALLVNAAPPSAPSALLVPSDEPWRPIDAVVEAAIAAG